MAVKDQHQYILVLNDVLEVAHIDALLLQAQARVIHHLGERSVIVSSSLARQELKQRLPDGISLTSKQPVDQTRSSSLTDKVSTPRKGAEILLDAAQHRFSNAFTASKRQRLNDGRQWGEGGLEAPGHDHEVHEDHDEDHFHGLSRSADFVAPINDRLVNSTAVSLVIVNGSGEYAISDEEKTNITAEVMDGLDWLASVRADANVSWSYRVETPTVNVRPWEGARWRGMPDKFYGGIDAAFQRGDNGKIYLFKGNLYVRFSRVSAGVDPGYPKPIEGNWRGMPAAFNQGIDAALWRESNGKLYFFKGSQYVRFSDISEGVDAGYPRQISAGWRGMPTQFNDGIDAALMRKDNGKIYFFKDDQYVRFSSVATGTDAGYPRTIKGNWKELPESFEKGINAALWRDSNNATYFFQNKRDNGRLYGTYVRFSNISEGVDSSYRNGVPIGLSSGEAERLWRNPAMAALGYGEGGDEVKHLAADVRDSKRAQHGICVFVTKYPTAHFAYAGGVRMVYRRADYSPGRTGNMDRVIAHEAGHLFGAPDEYASSGCSCSRKSGRFFTASNRNCANCENDENVPCIMRANSPGMCQNTPWHLGWGAFMTRIDTAFWRADVDKAYLFSGAQYIRYTDIRNGRDEGYPKSIAGNWRGLPESFREGIDAALWRKDNNKLYFFKGSQYVRFSKVSDGVDAGYPRSIAGNWRGLPDSFKSGIDAALWREDNGKVYFFKDNRYVRFSKVSDGVDEGYPRSIRGNWRGLTNDFNSGIDAALMRQDTDKVYFFKGSRYARFSNVRDGVDAGYPRFINGAWMTFPKLPPVTSPSSPNILASTRGVGETDQVS